MSRLSSLSLSLSLVTVASLLATGCSKNWKDDGDGPVTAGKDTDTGDAPVDTGDLPLTDADGDSGLTPQV